MAPKESGKPDWIGAFAVTGGIGEEVIAKAYKADHDDYNAILIQAVCDRLAEAFAEYLHEQVRKVHWGYAPDEALSNEELIRENYQGIRPAPGYPACPEHTEKGSIWELLDVERAIGMQLTESYAMWPGAAVSGWYFSPREQILRGGADPARSGGRLCPTQGHDPGRGRALAGAQPALRGGNRVNQIDL